MLRDRLLATRYAHEDGFRWRGREVSRIEGLSDAVFGFAITLLVVSLDVPKSAREVLEAMRGFGAFAVTFAILYRLWSTQYRFFRRYGLEDPTTRGLNAVLLFFVLVYIYPLKFLSTALLGWFVAGGPAHFRPATLTATIRDADVRALIYVYFLGSAAVFATLALLYLHAWTHRGTLALDEVEVTVTRASWERLAASAVATGVIPFAFSAIAFGHGHAAIMLEVVAWGALATAAVRVRLARAKRRAARLTSP